MPKTRAQVRAMDAAITLGRNGLGFRIAFALRNLQKQVRAEEVNAALAMQSPAPLYESDAWRVFESNLADAFDTAPGSPLMRTIGAAIDGTLKHTPPVDPKIFDRAKVYATAERWAGIHGAFLVRDIDTETRLAVREVVQDAFSRQQSTKTAARALLKIKGFGVTSQQSGALIKIYDDARAGGASASVARRVMRKAYERKRKARASLVARTEATKAAATAQRMTYSEAVNSGQLNPAEWVIEWVTRVARVCERCISMSGARAELPDGIFMGAPIVGGGPKLEGTRIMPARPPVHPGCYCAIHVVRRDSLP